MSVIFKSIAVILFVVAGLLGVTFGVGLPLNFIM